MKLRMQYKIKLFYINELRKYAVFISQKACAPIECAEVNRKKGRFLREKSR